MKQIVHSLPKLPPNPITVDEIDPDKLFGFSRNDLKYVLQRHADNTFNWVLKSNTLIRVMGGHETVKKAIVFTLKASDVEIFQFDSYLDLAKWLVEE